MNREQGIWAIAGIAGVAAFLLFVMAVGADYPHSLAYQTAKFLWSL